MIFNWKDRMEDMLSNSKCDKIIKRIIVSDFFRKKKDFGIFKVYWQKRRLRRNGIRI
jgi:hypothetical protein